MSGAPAGVGMEEPDGEASSLVTLALGSKPTPSSSSSSVAVRDDVRAEERVALELDEGLLALPAAAAVFFVLPALPLAVVLLFDFADREEEEEEEDLFSFVLRDLADRDPRLGEDADVGVSADGESIPPSAPNASSPRSKSSALTLARADDVPLVRLLAPDLTAPELALAFTLALTFPPAPKETPKVVDRFNTLSASKEASC